MITVETAVNITNRNELQAELLNRYTVTQNANTIFFF